MLVTSVGQGFGNDQPYGAVLHAGDDKPNSTSVYVPCLIGQIIRRNNDAAGNQTVGIIDAIGAHIVILTDIGRVQHSGRGLVAVTPVSRQSHVAADRVTLKIPVLPVSVAPADKDAKLLCGILRLCDIAACRDRLVGNLRAAVRVEMHGKRIAPNSVERHVLCKENVPGRAVGILKGFAGHRSGRFGVRLLPCPAKESTCLPVCRLHFLVLIEVYVKRACQGLSDKNGFFLNLQICFCIIGYGFGRVERTLVSRVHLVLRQRNIDMGLPEILPAGELLESPLFIVDFMLDSCTFP